MIKKFHKKDILTDLKYAACGRKIRPRSSSFWNRMRPNIKQHYRVHSQEEFSVLGGTVLSFCPFPMIFGHRLTTSLLIKEYFDLF